MGSRRLSPRRLHHRGNLPPTPHCLTPTRGTSWCCPIYCSWFLKFGAGAGESRAMATSSTVLTMAEGWFLTSSGRPSSSLLPQASPSGRWPAPKDRRAAHHHLPTQRLSQHDGLPEGPTPRAPESGCYTSPHRFGIRPTPSKPPSATISCRSLSGGWAGSPAGCEGSRHSAASSSWWACSDTPGGRGRWWRTMAIPITVRPAELHVLSRNPQVELVPCRRR